MDDTQNDAVVGGEMEETPAEAPMAEEAAEETTAAPEMPEEEAGEEVA